MKISDTGYFADLIVATRDLKVAKDKLNFLKDEAVKASNYEHAAFFRGRAGVLDVVLEELEEEIYGVVEVDKMRTPKSKRS